MARLVLCSSRRLLLPSLVLLLAACKGDDPPPASDSTGTTAASTSTGVDPSATSGMTTAPPLTTGADPDTGTTFGPGCGVDPCPGKCPRGCEITSTCIASVWTCECACDTTGTAGDGCPSLPEVVDAWVEGSKTPAIDCGTLGPADDAAAWQTAHDCMLIQLAGSAFRATWSQPDGTDPFEYGAAARVGESYEIGWFQHSGTSTLVEHACEQIVATPDCVVDVGQMCLTCEGQIEVEILCEDPA